MKTGILTGIMVVALALMACPTFAASNDENGKLSQSGAAEQEFGRTLPPMAYIAFCNRDEGQEECNFQGKVERVPLTPENWDHLVEVNNYVNTRIKPVTDVELYGVPDFWTYPVDAGDCEDYQLLKKRYLAQLGFSPDTLLMTVVLDENGEGHAVLTVATDQGDLILDNRRPQVLRWDRTGYTFLKRESQVNPRQWVSLRPNTTQVLVGTKSN